MIVVEHLGVNITNFSVVTETEKSFYDSNIFLMKNFDETITELKISMDTNKCVIFMRKIPFIITPIQKQPTNSK